MKIIKPNTVINLARNVCQAKWFGRIRPLNVELCLTFDCNLSCRYCGQFHEVRNNQRFGQQMSAQQITLGLKNLKQCGVKRINISGGEPLIRNDFDQIIQSAFSCGFQPTLILTEY